MNLLRLELAIVMLREVASGTWKPAPLEHEEPHGWADFIRNGSDKPDFDLSNWLIANEALPDGRRKRECGFSACAVGHMMIDPRFNAEGLVEKYDVPHHHVFRNGVSHRWDNGWDAVESFFDIGYEVARNLFDPQHYDREERAKGITAAMVADKIQDHIDRYKAEGHDK